MTASALATYASCADAQTARLPQVGILWHAGNEQEESPYLVPLQEGLAALGWIDGKTVRLVMRFAHEDYSRFPALAEELVQLRVDVILASIVVATRAAMTATRIIPIVAPTSIDPVSQGYTESISRPTLNVTGLATLNSHLAGKQIEILKEFGLNLVKVAIVVNPANVAHRRAVELTREAASQAHVELVIFEAKQTADIEQVIREASQSGVQGLVLPPDGLTFRDREQVGSLALAGGLAVVASMSELAEAGALASYGPDYPDLFRRSAALIDRLLRGSKPGDLPFEQPTRFKFVINSRTAEKLGLAAPTLLQALATEIID